MKAVRIILFVGILTGLLTSCKSLSKISTSDNDDVYLDPKRDRSAFFKPEAPKVVEPVAAAPVVQDSADNNPYYKEKDFSYDDYYDNQYASRLKRFHSPMCGVGYYDSYYTNSYFYNQNPYQYGVSIYNGYSFWGPSYNNYMYVPNYSWGNNYGYGSPYGYSSYYGNNWGWGGNNFGYNNYNNNYWNNPYYGNNYGGYGGWGNPYYNNFGYNNYGYNNGYDYNSSTYNGPRISHSGGNSKSVINPGPGNGRLMSQPVVDNSSPKTAVAPTDIKRFNVIETPKQNMVKGNQNTNESVPHVLHNNTNSNGTTTPPVKNNPKGFVKDENVNPASGNNSIPPPVNEPKPKKGNWFNANNENVPVTPRTNTTNNNNNSQPITPKKNNFDSGGGKTNSFPSNNSGGSNGGGTSRPSSSGGGTIKPRR